MCPTGGIYLKGDALTVADETWRSARADGLEATADAITDCLCHVDNVALALADYEALVAAGRAYAGFLRSARNDLISEARALRAVEA